MRIQRFWQLLVACAAAVALFAAAAVIAESASAGPSITVYKSPT